MRARALAVPVLLISISTSCVDHRASYDDFVARAPKPVVSQCDLEGGEWDSDSAESQVEECTLIDAGDLTGDWFVALGTPLSPTTPVVARLSVSASTTTDGLLALTFITQPLDALDRRTEVGPPLEPMTAIADTSFAIGVTDAAFDGRANPLIYGTGIEANITLCGRLCGSATGPRLDTFCGIGGGEIFSPLSLSLAGTTFSAARIEDPDHYPEPILIDCAGTEADDPL